MIKYLLLVLIFLPSCYRFINWSKVEFNQACNVKYEYLENAQNYIRTVKVYEQLDTLGIFDALLLSEPTERFFVTSHADKYNLTSQEKNQFLIDRVKKLDGIIAFYVLIQEPKACGEPFDERDAFWKVRMDTRLGQFLPNLIKKVDISCEYRMIFGKRFNRFKKAYYVEFDGFSKEGKNILQESDFITLCFSSFKKKTYLSWVFSGDILLPCDENYCLKDLEQCSTCCKDFGN